MSLAERATSTSRLDTPWGPVWRVWHHADAKQVLADDRFQLIPPISAVNRKLANTQFEDAGRLKEQGGDAEAGTTEVTGIEGSTGTDTGSRALRMRLLTAIAAPHNLRRRQAEIEDLARELAGQFTEPTSSALPVNASEAIAVPLCARAMCVLLGASAAESAHLVTSANPASTPASTAAAMAATIARVAPGVRAMIRRRQDDPQPDVVSELLVEAAGDRRAIARLTNMLSWLPMSSNWQLPSAVLDTGFSLLLTHPQQRARLAADPTLLPSAVDEICRHFVSSEASRGGLTRQAATDLTLGGVQMRAGDVVLVDIAAANRDEQVFADPLTFDIGRRPNPHLTFSHGPFMCRFGPTSRTLIAAGLSSGLPEMAGMLPTEPPAGISQAERRRLRDGEFEDLWLSR